MSENVAEKQQSSSKSEEHREHYSKAEFWDERYVEKGGFFDWYAEYPELKHCFETQYGMRHDDAILMVGCGNSKLSQQMYDAGYRNIVNVDISPSVIEQMRKVSPDMEWRVMDCTKMDFKDNTFDFVIDKGTMDALIAGRDLSPSFELLRECSRVTKEEGQLILITYGSPEGRKKVFENALPFEQFDYFFTYVNLNDMSTMINLMRNNLVGPDGEKVDKQQALQRSLKEFMMIKVMRGKRSKDKQFVVWENFTKQPHSEQSNSSAPTAQKSQHSDHTGNGNPPKQPQEQLPDKPEDQSQKEKPEEPKPEPKENESVKYMSRPQKQTYVYAYSVKRKFSYDFDSEKYQKLSSENVNFEGKLQNYRFEIRGNEQIQKVILQSLKYLEDKTITYCPCKYLRPEQQFTAITADDKVQHLRVDLAVGEGAEMTLKVLRKTNIELRLEYPELSKLSPALSSLCESLVEEMGLELHPCPKSYSLLSMLRPKVNAKTSSELLKKFWYPTFKITSIDCQSNTAKVVLAVPPVVDPILEKVKGKIQQCLLKIDKQLSVQIGSSKGGFVSFPQLRLFSLINMASLSFNGGKRMVVDLEDFWEGGDEKYFQRQDSNCNLKFSTVIVPEKMLPRIVTHFLALY